MIDVWVRFATEGGVVVAVVVVVWVAAVLAWRRKGGREDAERFP